MGIKITVEKCCDGSGYFWALTTYGKELCSGYASNVVEAWGNAIQRKIEKLELATAERTRQWTSRLSATL